MGLLEWVEECLKKQALSSQHLLDLINDVLDMSKIESGRIELRNSPFNFRAALEGLVNIYYAQARTKGIEFETILDEDSSLKSFILNIYKENVGDG